MAFQFPWWNYYCMLGERILANVFPCLWVKIYSRSQWVEQIYPWIKKTLLYHKTQGIWSHPCPLLGTPLYLCQSGMQSVWNHITIYHPICVGIGCYVCGCIWFVVFHIFFTFLQFLSASYLPRWSKNKAFLYTITVAGVLTSSPCTLEVGDVVPDTTTLTLKILLPSQYKGGKKKKVACAA